MEPFQQPPIPTRAAAWSAFPRATRGASLLATNITQNHVDSQSTGANLTETQLTSSNVNAADFGQLYNTPVDGQVYAEPLVLTNVTITAGPNTVGTPGTYDSVVFVATQNDSLYAIERPTAASSGSAVPGYRPIPTISPWHHLRHHHPERGHEFRRHLPADRDHRTPVIDPSTNVIYLIPNTKEIVGGDAYYVQRLPPSTSPTAPMPRRPSSSAPPPTATPITHRFTSTARGTATSAEWSSSTPCANNRPALSLVNGQVYAEWASHGDNGPYHGWVVAWNVTNLSTQGMVLAGVLCTDPNGGEGGIWGGGGGLTFDPDETINGNPPSTSKPATATPRRRSAPRWRGFPANDNYNESLVKVEADPTTSPTNQNSNGWGFKVVDYFTPYNVNALDDADEDFGSGSPLVLPDSAGIPGHPHLIVAAGKEGTIYLIDRDNLGKFNANDDNVLNSVYNPNTGITTPPVLINGSFSTRPITTARFIGSPVTTAMPGRTSWPPTRCPTLPSSPSPRSSQPRKQPTATSAISPAP